MNAHQLNKIKKEIEIITKKCGENDNKIQQNKRRLVFASDSKGR